MRSPHIFSYSKEAYLLKIYYSFSEQWIYTFQQLIYFNTFFLNLIYSNFPGFLYIIVVKYIYKYFWILKKKKKSKKYFFKQASSIFDEKSLIYYK